jgi:osmoprotectant transport system substrate-binding protein
MRKARRPIAGLAALAAAVGLVAGCTVSKKEDTAKAGGGSIKQVAELKGAKIKVGSKEFDEQLLLGQIAIAALQAAGADPVDKTNITGSDNVRKALTTGAIDLYWEYTGTAWVSYLKHTTPVAGAAQQYAAVKKGDVANNVTWWARSPSNDTFAIAEKQTTAAKYGTKSLSDYAALAKKNPSAASMCVDSEFANRDDGFPGVQKAYGFSLPKAQEHLVDIAVIFTGISKGTCNFGVVTSTDGRIPAQKLQVLVDDKHFFPVYNPAISIRSAVAKKYPQLEQVFAPIATKLDTATLTELNKKVSVDGEKPATVARDWLKSEGFIG